MGVIDCVTYNGEKSVLNIRLNVLSPYVDRFVICEAKTTFSGLKKPLYFPQHEKKFSKFWHKIDYHIINENYSDAEIQLAEKSPNTMGASHWKSEFLQKESIKKALRFKAKDDDIVYIGDVDEIWEPYVGTMPAKLKLRVYAYYLDNRSDEEFWGTIVARWGDIKDQCLNHLRTNTTIRTPDYYGWHFTSMGGLNEVRRKLNDSYTTESYNTYTVQSHLPERIRAGVDYLGRPFHFRIDQSEWPKYLKHSEFRYRHMCKKVDSEESTVAAVREDGRQIS